VRERKRNTYRSVKSKSSKEGPRWGYEKRVEREKNLRKFIWLE
jgi:hypothetical protein